MYDKRLNRCWYLLKLTYGLLFIIAGIDKFLNEITYWEKYVSKYILDIIPLSLQTFISIVGIFEIALGILILIPKWTKIGANIGSLWLVAIALNLISMKIYYDIAIRDIVMAIGVIALGILTSVIQSKN